MAWAAYSSAELTARKYELSRSKGVDTWTLALPDITFTWERDSTIIEYAADGWSEAGASATLDAVIAAGGKNAEASRSGESGKYMVRWTQETYGEWELPE
jgi:hypothetical protein